MSAKAVRMQDEVVGPGVEKRKVQRAPGVRGFGAKVAAAGDVYEASERDAPSSSVRSVGGSATEAGPDIRRVFGTDVSRGGFAKCPKSFTIARWLCGIRHA